MMSCFLYLLGRDSFARWHAMWVLVVMVVFGVVVQDKWKTLVHTARISPQQRRGEPVPQELLDRVLAAHAYWSKQQAKQQLKQQPETCLLSSEKY
jgi:hypothetical protein